MSGDTSMCHEIYIQLHRIPNFKPCAKSNPIFHNFYKLLRQLLVFLAVKSFFSYIVPLVDFCIGCCAFNIISKKLLPNPMARSFFLMFSSGRFKVSSFMFKSIILCQLIFASAVTKGANFIFLHVAIHFSQDNLLKILSFLR